MSIWQNGEIACSGIEREKAVIFQTLDMMVPDGAGAYLAGPISTGRRFYDALARTRTSNYSELIAAIGVDEYLKLVRWPNVAESEVVAAALRTRGVQFLINTAPLLVSGWQGSDYMDLCYKLIQSKVKTVYFHGEWAFSSGAVKEYLFCGARGIPCLTLDGNALDIDAARSALTDACGYLGKLSVAATSLEASLRELDALAVATVTDASHPRA